LTVSLLSFAEGDRSISPVLPVRDVVEQYVESVKPELEDRQIRVESDLAPVEAKIPSKYLRTVLDSLVTNASEAMNQGGTLRIELASAAQEREVVLRITDTGTGISEEHQPRLFEPFFTTKNGGSEPQVHAGLGLAVAHGIVRDLKGSIRIETRPGRGTTCTVRLPAGTRSAAFRLSGDEAAGAW
jgi:two-component system NtrC family sensor kinase